MEDKKTFPQPGAAPVRASSCGWKARNTPPGGKLRSSADQEKFRSRPNRKDPAAAKRRHHVGLPPPRNEAGFRPRRRGTGTVENQRSTAPARRETDGRRTAPAQQRDLPPCGNTGGGENSFRSFLTAEDVDTRRSIHRNFPDNPAGPVRNGTETKHGDADHDRQQKKRQQEPSQNILPELKAEILLRKFS